MENTLYNTTYCQLQHIKDKNAILCTWKQFCKGDDYRIPLIEEIKEQKIALSRFFKVKLVEDL